MIEEFSLKPIDPSMSCIKKEGTDWLIEMAGYMYIAVNPQFLLYGFMKAGITGTLRWDGCLEDDENVEDSKVPSEDYMTRNKENDDVMIA